MSLRVGVGHLNHVESSSEGLDEWPGDLARLCVFVGREGYYSLRSAETARSRGRSCSISVV